MTTKQKMLKTASEPIIARVIRDIKSKTKRSIRNSVELGLYFSKSDVSREFFEFLKNIIDKSENIYHKLILNTFSRVEENVLKTLGVNIWLSSFYIGAKQLKARDDFKNTDSSWIGTFSNEELSDIEALENKIQSYIDKGVYFFIFKEISDSEKLFNAVSTSLKFSNCTFAVRMCYDNISDDELKMIKGSRNIIVAVENEDSSIVENVLQKLSQSGLFYGICKNYVSGAPFDFNGELSFFDFAVKYSCAFITYIDTNKHVDYDCEFYKNICNNRVYGKYPVLLLDFYNDCSYIKDVMIGKKRLSLATASK